VIAFRTVLARLATAPPAVAALALTLGLAGSAATTQAQDPYRRYVPAAAAAVCVPPSGPSQLGTFTPDRTLFIGGPIQPTVGPTTLGMFGPDVGSVIGPLSALRETAAPVLTYSRGYDGTLVPSMGTSFSNPNLPGLSPIKYPTRANIAPGPGPRIQRPRYWPPATNWIDQN
jgi:hypothetical protein